MKIFLLILLVIVLLGGIYAYQSGMINIAKTPTKTLIEVDTGRMKENVRDTVNNLDAMLEPTPKPLPAPEP